MYARSITNSVVDTCLACAKKVSTPAKEKKKRNKGKMEGGMEGKEITNKSKCLVFNNLVARWGS